MPKVRQPDSVQRRAHSRSLIEAGLARNRMTQKELAKRLGHRRFHRIRLSERAGADAGRIRGADGEGTGVIRCGDTEFHHGNRREIIQSYFGNITIARRYGLKSIRAEVIFSRQSPANGRYTALEPKPRG